MATDVLHHPSEQELLKKIADLQRDLTTERQRNCLLHEELKALRTANVHLQAEVEQEEEFISNKLTKRLAELQNEKERLAMEVELEEEFLTNTLQKKLDEVKRSKIDLENQLEQEQEYITNKLQKQLEKVMAEKHELEKLLEENASNLMEKLLERLRGEQLQASKSVSVAEEKLIARMAREIDSLRLKQKQFEAQVEDYKLKNETLGGELQHLRNESFLLSQQVTREKEKRGVMSTEMSRMEIERETNQERHFNQRRNSLSRPPASP